MYVTVILKHVVKRIIILYYYNCFNFLTEKKSIKALMLSKMIKVL